MADRAFLIRLTKELTNQGKLIEAGWVGFRLAAIRNGTPPGPLEDMHNAFMAGAAHLFSSIVSTLDPGEEPSDADLARLDNIHRELEAWEAEFKRKHNIEDVDVKGHA
jgi:hypothetical protein